jgi:hypothetical protein
MTGAMEDVESSRLGRRHGMLHTVPLPDAAPRDHSPLILPPTDAA